MHAVSCINLRKVVCSDHGCYYGAMGAEKYDQSYEFRSPIQRVTCHFSKAILQCASKYIHANTLSQNV